MSEAALDRGVLAASQEEDLRVLADLQDDTRRYYVPDITVIHPDAHTVAEQREAIAMVAHLSRSATAAMAGSMTRSRTFPKPITSAGGAAVSGLPR